METASRTRAFLVLSSVMALTATLVGAGPVLAQTVPAAGTAPAAGSAPPPGAGSVGVGVVAPAPSPTRPEFGFESGIPPGQEGAREEEFYPERTRSIHQPAFVRGAVKTVRTSKTSGVRVGLSGWTAPRVPFDSQRESSGGLSFGLTIEWGTPLPEPTQPAPPAQR
jgi:hypothetical protein